MRLLRLVPGAMAILWLAWGSWAFAQAGGNSLQNLVVDTQKGFLGAQQAIEGFSGQGLGGEGTVTLNLSNSTIKGLYNTNSGVGTARNQASVIWVNLLPNQYFSPFTFSWQNLSGNLVGFGDYEYVSRLQAGGLQGGGLVVMNLMAGNFNNQFTSVSLHLSRGPLPTSVSAASGSSFFLGGDGQGGYLVALSHAQLEAVAAASNNSFTELAKGKATAMMEGDAFKNFSGLVAISNLAGNGNQVQNNLQLTINLGK